MPVMSIVCSTAVPMASFGGACPQAALGPEGRPPAPVVPPVATVPPVPGVPPVAVAPAVPEVPPPPVVPPVLPVVPPVDDVVPPLPVAPALPVVPPPPVVPPGLLPPEPQPTRTAV